MIVNMERMYTIMSGNMLVSLVITESIQHRRTSGAHILEHVREIMEDTCNLSCHKKSKLKYEYAYMLPKYTT